MHLKSTVVKTVRKEGCKTPKSIEIETPFFIGRRLNVEYDLPRGRGTYVGYANYVYGKSGKAVGLFEVTDIYLNMLVNPNFVMVELTSRDKEFDRVHPDCKTMLLDGDVVIKRSKSIDEAMIVAGLKQGIIVPLLEDGVLKAKIGDNWFYFGGTEFEYTDPKDIPFDVLVKEIEHVLDDFEGEPMFNDEYLYYYAHLHERLKDFGVEENSVNRLIDAAKMRSDVTVGAETVKDEIARE